MKLLTFQDSRAKTEPEHIAKENRDDYTETSSLWVGEPRNELRNSRL